MGDQLFTDHKLPEWYHGGEISSAHNTDSIKRFELPYSYVLFCYPRDNTPVCTGELIELQKNLKKFQVSVIAASTDSPESHSLFFNNDEAFPPSKVPNIEFPVLTLREGLFREYGRQIIFNEYGYCRRIALVVKHGTVRGVYQTDNNKPRNVDVLVDML